MYSAILFVQSFIRKRLTYTYGDQIKSHLKWTGRNYHNIHSLSLFPSHFLSLSVCMCVCVCQRHSVQFILPSQHKLMNTEQKWNNNNNKRPEITIPPPDEKIPPNSFRTSIGNIIWQQKHRIWSLFNSMDHELVGCSIFLSLSRIHVHCLISSWFELPPTVSCLQCGVLAHRCHCSVAWSNRNAFWFS